jgi:hypothetical protein
MIPMLASVFLAARRPMRPGRVAVPAADGSAS